MDSDPSLLAARASRRADLKGCVILSRDGLVLGAHPEEAAQMLVPARVRLASLGFPKRAFVQFEEEMWAFVRGRAYSAFAVAAPTALPGLLLDLLDGMLEDAAGSDPFPDGAASLTAELGLLDRDLNPFDDGRTGPDGSTELAGGIATVEGGESEAWPPASPRGAPSGHEHADSAEGQVPAPRTALGRAGEGSRGLALDDGSRRAVATDAPSSEPPGDDPEVDAIALASEFGNLLQERPSGDEYSS